MAKKIIKADRVLVGAQDVSDYVSSSELSFPHAEVDVTAFADSVRDAEAGLEEGSVNLQGFMTDTDDPESSFWSNLRGTDGVVSWFTEGKSIGDIGHMSEVLWGQHEQGGQVGDALGFTIQATQSGVFLVRGLVAETGDTQRTGSVNGSGVQAGAASASQTLYASLHVFQFDGTSLDIDVESDADSGFATATTRVSFTQLTDVGSELVSVAGAITDDWYRFAFTFTGTSFTAAGLIGVQ